MVWGPVSPSLPPSDPLTSCCPNPRTPAQGRYRYAVSVVELRDRADQPSAAVETVSGLLGAFEDPITMRDNIPTPRLPVVNLRMLALAGGWGLGSEPGGAAHQITLGAWLRWGYVSIVSAATVV